MTRGKSRRQCAEEMCGLDCGGLYEAYHSRAYNPAQVSQEVKLLYADPFVKKRGGVFEYILGGSTETKLLDVRVFDESTERAVYEKQTQAARAAGASNCPLCGLEQGRGDFGGQLRNAVHHAQPRQRQSVSGAWAQATPGRHGPLFHGPRRKRGRAKKGLTASEIRDIMGTSLENVRVSHVHDAESRPLETP